MRCQFLRNRAVVRACSIYGGCAALWLTSASFALHPAPPAPDVLARQQAQYDAEVTKTILELQPFRTESQIPITGTNGVKGTATLVNLNPYVGTWYLLSLDWGTVAKPNQYHLESPHPQSLRLSPTEPGTVRIAGPDRFSCTTPVESKRGLTDASTAVTLPYAPLCDGVLYIRN
ncbi:MAG TPA: hypothetical protein VGC34_01365, partial [Steroidobacteraceae bacterium]